jgi:hypothetical protein
VIGVGVGVGLVDDVGVVGGDDALGFGESPVQPANSIAATIRAAAGLVFIFGMVSS